MITKRTENLSDINFAEGEVLLIDKPAGWSSFKVIEVIRNSVGTRRIGHAGTLDPLATGLLILCTGKKTKSISEFQDLTKTYTGTIKLGISTPSMDTETESVGNNPYEHITEEDVFKTKEKFTGKILQVPPMYSAKKHKGKPLYEYARKGREVERKAVEITIHSFEIKRIALPEIMFEISCSKGSYIRVIANDFGQELGCGGVLSELRRTKIGDYDVNDAFSPDELIKSLEYGRQVRSSL